MSLKKYVNQDSIKGLTHKEIYFRFRRTDTFIGDSRTISYINEVIKTYLNEEKNTM
jgi:hypothetical protein